MSGDTRDTLAVLLAEIAALDRPACIDSWREALGRPPPKHLSLQFMKRVLIWELQNQRLGGVSAKTKRRADFLRPQPSKRKR